MLTKDWMDKNVIPVKGDLKIVSFLWKGDGPEEVLTFLEGEDHNMWCSEVKRLLQDEKFAWDFHRDPAPHPHNEKTIMFGVDGAPFINKKHHILCRLFKKVEDGTALILDISTKTDSALKATNALKEFFDSFNGENPFTLFQPNFGEA